MRRRQPGSRTSRPAAWIAIAVALLSCTPQQCQQWQPIATALADDDSDGWFTDTTNVAISLDLTSASFTMPGDYGFIVDEARFPQAPGLDGQFSVPVTQLAPAVFSLSNTTVATRTRGVQGFNAGGTPFSAQVRLVKFMPVIGQQLMGVATVPFGETAGALAPVTINGGPIMGTVTINLSVRRATFADPTPHDSLGDADMDGIPEAAEARLASRFGGTFDPRPGMRDIDVVIGHTAPNFALDSLSRVLLTSRFRVNGIVLHLDDGMLAGVSGAGGAMNLAGTGATATGVVDTLQTRAVRNANVGPQRRRFAYFVLLAGNASDDGTTTAFGMSNDIPGNTLVMRNGPIAGGAAGLTLEWYQSGVFMHELGHLLGLCHPTQSDGTIAGCAAIPVAERDPGATVMGAPSEDPNIAVAGINVLRRPLDYTATQWTQLRVGAGLRP